MLPSEPGHSATVLVALATSGVTPSATIAGNVSSVPPPAMAFTAPAPRAATSASDKRRIVGSVIGAFVGSFAGAALFEYSLSRAPATAVRAGWGAVVGRATAAAAKIALGVVIAVLGLFAALRG